MFSLLIWIFATLTLSTSLQHEKSFLVQDGASVITTIAIYQNSILLTSSNDIIQKDIGTGLQQRVFRAHTNQILSFGLTNDSRMITAGWDDMIIVWDLKSGSIMKRIWLGSSDTNVQSVSFWNEQVITGGDDEKIRRVDLTTGRVSRTVDLGEQIFCVLAYGDFVFLGRKSFDAEIAKIRLLNLNFEIGLDGHSNTVISLHLDNNILFSGSVDTTIIAWNPDTGQQLRKYFGHVSYVWALKTVGEQLYSAGNDQVIFKWNINDGTLIQKFPRYHINKITSLAIKDDSIFSGAFDTEIVRWNLTTYQFIQVYKTSRLMLRSVVVWNDFVLSGGDESVVAIWDKSTDSIEPLSILSGHLKPINTMFISGDWLFTGSSDATVKQWELIDLTQIGEFIGHFDTVSALTVSENILYSGGNDLEIILWNISSKAKIDGLNSHTDEITCLTAEKELLFSTSYDETVKIWNRDTGTLVQNFQATNFVKAVVVQEDQMVIGTYGGLFKIQISTLSNIAEQLENFACTSIVWRNPRIYSAYVNGVIKVSDSENLNVLGFFYGHQNIASSLCFDTFGTLFSASFDGSTKKWDLVTRKVAFSFENRRNSVTSLAASGNFLYTGLRNGLVNKYVTDNAMLLVSSKFHEKDVTSLIIGGGRLYSTGLDGLLISSNFSFDQEPSRVFISPNATLKSIIFHLNSLVFIENDRLILQYPFNGTMSTTIFVESNVPITCLAADDERIYAGSISGAVLAWNANNSLFQYELKGHTSKVNYILLNSNHLFSASDDQKIIKWSLIDRVTTLELKRNSPNTLGHLGPVNALSSCKEYLFSGGSDLTVRRWDVETGKHIDVYFGFSKVVTSVLCFNNSVFGGSEDYSVLQFRPGFKKDESTFSTPESTKAFDNRKRTKAVAAPAKQSSSRTESLPLIISFSGVAFLIFLVATIFVYLKKFASRKSPLESKKTETDDCGFTVTDLQTVVNTVLGISKHAAFVIPNSALAKQKKIATGGGGEVYLARIMEPDLRTKHGDVVIQKFVFIKNSASEDSFYLEVGIMIMLLAYPHFCQIIGYTENPLSMILKFYPDGSLESWLRKNSCNKNVIGKVCKDIAGALRIMHSLHLAHCDIKPQNVLIEVMNGVPSCFLTDFGITQVLSTEIIAVRSFNAINLKGLSIPYASPEAFSHFRSKAYTRVDFKKYDVFSLACIMYEVVTHKAPWS